MKNTSLTVIWIAAVVGVIDSAYLAYIKFSHVAIYCTPGLGDCATVNSSRWSELWGIPIALFGLATYLAVLFLVAFGSKIKFAKPYVNYALFGIGLVGFLYSLYLTYLELFVIRAICQWCILSAICITVIFIASIFRLKDQEMQYQ
jgi:uncharacterized membrane protein